MDFANRSTRPVGSDGVAPSTQPAGGSSHKVSKMSNSKLTRIMTVVMLFAGTLLAVALIVLVVFGRTLVKLLT